MESDKIFIHNLLWSSTPSYHFDKLSLRRRWQHVSVCLFWDVHMPVQYVFMLVFVDGEAPLVDDA